MSLKNNLILLGACVLVSLSWIAGCFEREDFTEAHDLYWGDGVYLNPIEHERRIK